MAVELNWSKPHNTGNFIYYIFRSEQADFEPSANNQIAQYDIITNNTYVDSDITIGKTYYYKVIGLDIDLNRQSPVSNQLKVSIQTKNKNPSLLK